MKKILSITAVLSVLAMILVSCGNDDSKKLSPEEQLKKTMTKTFVDNSKLVSSGLTQYKNSVELNSYGEDLTVSFELGEPMKALANAIIAENFTDVDTQWLKNVQVSLKTALTDNAMQVSAKVGINNTDIVSANVFENSSDSTVYLSIPELIKNNFKVSEKDFGFSAKEMLNNYLNQVSFMKNIPEEAIFTGFIEEFVNTFVSSLGTVSKSTEELKAGMGSGKTVAANYTVLSAKMDMDTGEALAESMENLFLNSTNFNAIANWIVPILSQMEGYKIRVKDFTEEVADSVASVFEDIFYNDDVTVKLYVDSQSSMAGCRIDIGEEGVILAIMPQDKKNFGYTFAVAEYAPNLSIENIATSAMAAINGYGTYVGGKMTGDFKVYSEGEELVTFVTKDLDITSLKSAKVNGSISIHPKSEINNMAKDMIEDELNVAGSALAFVDNLDLSFVVTQKDYTSADTKIIFSNGNTDLLSMSISNAVSKPKSIAIPTTDIFELNEDSLYDYEKILKEIDTSVIISNLKKANVAPEYIKPLESVTTDMLDSLVEDFLF